MTSCRITIHFQRKKNTLRGLHFQSPPYAQAKLVRCGRGAIFDVAVDIRKGSPTFGHWQGYELTAENGEQLYLPIGFAHGFLTLKPYSEIIYKCSDYYAPECEGSVLWSDPDIGINLPRLKDPILSVKDENAPLFKNIDSPFIFGEFMNILITGGAGFIGSAVVRACTGHSVVNVDSLAYSANLKMLNLYPIIQIIHLNGLIFGNERNLTYF